MKKYLLQIALFFAIVAVVDFAAGKLFRYVQSNRAGGRTGAEWYACRESNEDIIIMGSSRASHHYVPQILSDSLGMSCFNAGQDGNGIILQYGRWKMISERYHPRIIIYDINPSFDLVKNDNMTYIDRLKPFCDDIRVNNYVVELFPIEKLKLFSQTYRYNYKFLEIISDCKKKKSDETRGYIPLFGQIREEVVNKPIDVTANSFDLDEIKIFCLEKLAKECQAVDTKLVFVVSPFYKGGGFNEDTFIEVKKIAEKYGSEFVYLNVGDKTTCVEWYKDSAHLNDTGACEFTKELCCILSRNMIN